MQHLILGIPQVQSRTAVVIAIQLYTLEAEHLQLAGRHARLYSLHSLSSPRSPGQSQFPTHQQCTNSQICTSNLTRLWKRNTYMPGYTACTACPAHAAQTSHSSRHVKQCTNSKLAPQTSPLNVPSWPPPMRPRPAPAVDIESRTPAAAEPARVTAAPQPGRVKTKRGKTAGKEQARRIAASRAPPAPPAQPSGTKRKSTNTNIPSQPSSSSSPLTKTFFLKMFSSEQYLQSLNRKARSLESSFQVRIYFPDESGRYSSASVEFSC